MKQFFSLVLMISFVLLQGCGDMEPIDEASFSNSDGSNNTAGTGSRGLTAEFDRQASRVAFSTTVHPLAMRQCADCHSPSGSTLQQAPFHGHTDYSIAHDSVVDTARVNFLDIPRSRLVVRLREDAHYCWSSDCEADAAEMQAAIEAWVSQLDLTGVTGLNGVKTDILGISQADIRLPETINGTIVMQAESGILSGRFKTKQNSKASDFLFVGTDSPPPHPIEGTSRTPLINFKAQGCRVPTAEELQNTVTGPFRIREPRRHVDQTGYRYYAQQIKVRYIRPQLRTEFMQALNNGFNASNDEPERFFMNSNRPADSEKPDGLLDGDEFFVGDLVRVLPEFRDKTFFDQTLHGDMEEANRDFFAPRFGFLASEFWTANDAEIRTGLVDTLKTGHLYNNIIDRYRRWFF